MPNIEKDHLSPAERRQNRVRRDIITAAERLFIKEGEAGLSIRKLADEIDYSPGAIYKYFDSKQSLIDELKEAFFEQLLSEFEGFEGAPSEYPAFALNFLATYVRTGLRKRHHYAAAFAGFPNEGDLAAALRGNTMKSVAFRKLRNMVEDGMRLGAFRPDLDVIQSVKYIWASLHGLVGLMSHLPNLNIIRCEENPPDRDEFITKHLDLILRGLLK